MKKTIKIIAGLLLTKMSIYLLILVFPNFMFGYSYAHQNFKIYSDRPIPKSIIKVIDDANQRLLHSELYLADENFKVYVCNDDWRFKFFTRNGNAGGLVNFLISPNIFIRECNIDRNALIPPSGWMYTPAERPLSYYIAHEAVHSLQREISPFLVFTTPTYILEGYADYIGKRPDFDYQEYKEMYLNDAYLMNPKNGLYHKYHFYIAHLIEKKGYSFDKILNEKPDLELILKQASN